MKVYALAEIKRALQKIDVLPLIKEGFIAYSSGLTVVPPVGELLFDNPPGDVHIKYGYIKNDEVFMSTIITKKLSSKDLIDSNVVKVLVDENQNAINFNQPKELASS